MIKNLSNPTIFLTFGLMVIIVMMVLPMPSWMLDIGLAASFSFAILIFTLTLFIEKPLDFSSFPAVLLASLLLRLSLNISSTKLIIGQGHTGTGAAGGVIEGFANFIMGGNIFIGLIVFSVLVIVNFMVITKGAGRMAEVGARFALDAMPGKQMAIDADLAAGAINHQEAKLRRETEQEETAFLGSLDGVSKFMKGDAIAGILITLLNLIAGISIGLIVHGISFSEAVENYSILTVGDGLVSQIPAVIISIAAGLLLSKGRSQGTFDLALLTQFKAHPSALLAVAGIMLLFGLIPGLPFLPFTMGALILGGVAWLSNEQKKSAASVVALEEKARLDAPEEDNIGDNLDVDALRVELSPNLVPHILESDSGFDGRIQKIRKYIALEYGFILPPIRLKDNATLPQNSYRLLVQGAEACTEHIFPGKKLILVGAKDFPEIKGAETLEPVFKAPARWVNSSYENEIQMLGLTAIDSSEVLATHILETIKNNFSKLLTRQVLQDTLEALKNVSEPDRADKYRRLIDDFIPDKLPWENLQGVLRLLLDERIPIRNLPVIIETIYEARQNYTTLDQIVEFVRQRLAYQFITPMRDENGRLPIVRLGHDWEDLFTQREVQTQNGTSDVALTVSDFDRLYEAVKSQVDKAATAGIFAVVTTSAARRRLVRNVLSAKGVSNPVFSYEEIARTEKPLILGVA